MTRDHFWILRFAFFTILFLQLVVPSLSDAEVKELSAGFAPRSIWLSRTHVVAGDSVNIFTVLYNSSDNSISGDVIFAIDSATIGTKNFTLGAGETQIVSLPWIAKVGSHSVSARIEKALDTNTNTATAVLNQTTGNITVLIEAPPPPSQAVQVLSSVTSAIQTGFASSSPKVLSALNSLYGKTESIRAEAKTVLEKKVAENAKGDVAAKSYAGKQPSASASSSSSTAQSAEPFLSTAGRYAALAGLTVVSSKTLFYISLALVFILLIQMLRVLFRERRGTRRNRFTGYS